MFAAPPEINARLYCTLPDKLRLEGQPSRWAKGQPNVGALHSLLEGPCFGPDGTLYCVDVAYGRIFAVNGGEISVARTYDGQPNGMRWRGDTFVIADYQNGIMTFSLKTGRVEPMVTRFRAEPFKGVNDLTFASNGDLYFTDQGLSGLHEPSGRVFRLGDNGDLQVVLDHCPSPNGLVLSRDETELYVAMTRDNAIWRVPLLPDGGTSKVGRFIALTGGTGPDGLAMDIAGNLYVAHVGLGCVWRFNAAGEPTLRISCGEGRGTTNIVFGGAEHRTLIITEAQTGSLYSVEVDIPGCAPHVQG